MVTEQTEQGEQIVLPGAERVNPPEAPRKPAKPQKSFESTPLFSGLPPHQDSLF